MRRIWAVGILLVAMSLVMGTAIAADLLVANANHKFSNNNVYSGKVDHFYCSWQYLSGAPHDAWKVEIPLYYVRVLDNWDGGSMWTEPGYYTWFIVDDVRAGDSSPYDIYYNLPAPWIKVMYSSDSTVTVTYTCKASLWDHIFDINGIPLYWKAVEATDSFTVTISPIYPASTSSTFQEDKLTKTSGKIRDFSEYRELALTQGKKAVINALKKNPKNVDAITLEYDDGKWIVRGYKMRGKYLEKLVFEYTTKVIVNEQ